MSRMQRGFYLEEDIQNILAKLEALANKDKEVLLKSNIEVKFNTQNIQQFNFTKYRKLKFVFFIKDESGNRTGQKIFEIALIDNNTPTSFSLDGFWAWINSNRQNLDIRIQTEDNRYKFCDIYRYYIKIKQERKDL